VTHRALLDKTKIYLSSLHIKLGLIKMFVKSKDSFLRQKFPRISETNIKEDIFVGPQVKQLFQDPDLRIQFNSTERRTWETFKNLCCIFLGNKKLESYEEIVEELFPHTVPWGATCR
jgi:hypothetical protein